MTEEIKTEISTDCSYYKDVVNQIKAECPSFRKTSDGVELCQGGNIGIFNEYSYLCVENKNCYYKQLKRLEQENGELKAYKDVNEDFKKAWDELNEKYKQLRSALEKIREIIRADCKRCTAECDCDDDCTRHKIKTKINEVLNDN